MKILATVAVVLLLALPAAAKINLTGSMYATYWAQQEGVEGYQIATASGWQDIATQPNNLYRGTTASASKKTFLFANSRAGNGLQNHPEGGYGIALGLDCPVTDQWKAYARFAIRGGSANLNTAARHLWIAYTPMREFGLRVGRYPVPFGNEGYTRPTEKVKDIFISEYTQDFRGALNANYDIGVTAFGTVVDGMIDYKLYFGNGAITTVGDSINRGINNSGQTYMVANIGVNNSALTPDINDAKQVIGQVHVRPFANTYLGGSYAAGDYTNDNLVNNVAIQRARFTAYNLFAGYTLPDQFKVSGEYATTRHDRMSLESDAGVIGAPAVRQELVANRVNEYIVKAYYLGLRDWEFGVRYSGVDPKNFEAELAAGYSYETKLSAAIGYKFAGSAMLNAEYSRVHTDLSYYDKYNAAALAGAYRITPSVDPNDDIFALQLTLHY